MIARNNLALTKRAVASVLAQDIGDVRLMLIDNMSTDGTAEWMCSQRDEYRLHFAMQQSVATCWNIGLDWLFSHGAEHVLVANNDVELRPETMRLLVADGGQFVTAVGVNTREQMGNASLEPKNKRPHPDFSCFLIRKECFERVGGFDERYEIAFGEDCDMHVRLHRASIDAHCIGVPFYHVGSATVKNSDPREKERIGKQADLNRELFYRTYGQRIGTPGYDLLFSPETFGCDNVVVSEGVTP